NRARSDCHAWGSSPNIEFFRIVLGIDTAAPGFARVRLAPHLGALTQAQGSVPHPNGEVRVRYAQDPAGAWTAEVSLPPGTPGELVWQGKTYPLGPGETKVFKW
nr:alpha-rhamnosidase [Bernardetiaceae bacterium]